MHNTHMYHSCTRHMFCGSFTEVSARLGLAPSVAPTAVRQWGVQAAFFPPGGCCSWPLRLNLRLRTARPLPQLLSPPLPSPADCREGLRIPAFGRGLQTRLGPRFTSIAVITQEPGMQAQCHRCLSAWERQRAEMLRGPRTRRPHQPEDEDLD